MLNQNDNIYLLKIKKMLKSIFDYWRKGWDSSPLHYEPLVNQSRSVVRRAHRWVRINPHVTIQQIRHPKWCLFRWRKGWDSNPCAENSATAFRVRLVMTTSIPFRVSIKL